MLQKKKLFVFDIDGTLSDSVPLYQRAFIDSIQKLGVKTDPNFKTFKHHSDSYIGKVVYETVAKKKFDQSTILKFEDLLLDYLQRNEKIIEIKGAAKTINFLEKETEFGVCFATGSFLKTAIYKLNEIGISFDPIQLVASNDIEDREGIVSKAIEGAKAFYQQDHFEIIISVGDGIWDLKTAKNLNLHFIGVGKDNKELLAEQGATMHLTDYTQFNLKDILNNIK